jgi:PKD repeat protein
MRGRSAAVSVMALITAVPLAVGVTAGSAVGAVQAAALAPGVTAFYEMNEPPGTTVMTDSGPNGLNGSVDPTGVESGAAFDGATGYNWVRRPPEDPPASPERVIQVPDNPNLEPGNGPFTIELRYRTKEKFGNIAQKGQAQTPGGQWKIQAPGGIPSCLFKGSAGQVATGALTPINDEQWHDLTCVFTSTGVSLYVDGQFRNRKNGTAGTVDNNFPMTVGGKIDCDQIKVTCDYFSGQIDFLKLTKAANLLPTAGFGTDCFGLACAFDSTSSDPDGSVVQYAWDFGDGGTSTVPSPAHTYGAPGTYRVRLTVTDNQGATDVKTVMTTVADAPPIESPVDIVGSAAAQANSNRPAVAIPTGVTPGDRLLMVLSYNNLARTVGAPTGVSGWTRLGDLSAGTMGSVAFTKIAQGGDAGTTATVPLSGNAKYTLTVAAYTGADGTTPDVAFQNATNTSTTATRTAPAVTVPEGAWVASYWADKSATTTSWTPASGTSRRSICGADGGRICSLLADSGEPLPPGVYRAVDASTNAPSDMAVMWSFVVAPSADGPPANHPPTAAFEPTCTLLDCGFDSSGSADDDGTIASYSWDFGDGDTSTDANPDHPFDEAGSYDVTLTVTDDDGDTGTVTQAVDVQGVPADSSVDYVGSAVAAGNTANPSANVPGSTSAGDRLVLALSLNNTARTFTGPTGAGWTLLDDVIAGDMRTAVWTKVATAAMGGATVSVPLSGVSKFTVTLAAYTGVDSTASTLPFARAIDTSNHAARQTPSVNAPAGAWVISYWADKSSTTTAWTPPGSVTERRQGCGADAGRICSLFADSGAAVTAGPYPGLSASTNTASAKATTWAIVLPPAL